MVLLYLDNVKVDFIKDIHIGKRAYHLTFDKNGFEEKVEDVADKCANFSCVCLKGKPFRQKKNLSKLCKSIQKKNPETLIIIKTDGKIKPVYMTTLKNVEYLVYVKSRKSTDSLNDKINRKAFNWFGKAGAKFVFQVNDMDDLDNVDLIRNGLKVTKGQIYINVLGKKTEDMIYKIRLKGFNLYKKQKGEWYDE